jgi:benzoyl-CoA-dihydrodiol lyase
MAEAEQKLANGSARIDFATDPSRYRHWKLAVDGKVATLLLDVNEKGSLFAGYDLKLNSYDLGVDIELADAFERIRFERPEVRVVLLRSGKPRVFSAGANIRMLAGASHAHKVNFCKFTNETRNAIEDASVASGVRTICIINGTAAGGGYELALAADHIILVDDGASAVSLPEVPLLAVLPGTGGLTRITDKRKVRRDRADAFCTTALAARGRHCGAGARIRRERRRAPSRPSPAPYPCLPRKRGRAGGRARGGSRGSGHRPDAIGTQAQRRSPRIQIRVGRI